MSNTDVSKAISDMAGQYDVLSTLLSTKEVIVENTPKWINKLHKFGKGCEEVPDRAERVFVYFVTYQTNKWCDVQGYMLNEKDKIVHNVTLPFDYLIFYPKEATKFGIKPFASGTMLNGEYFDSNMGELCRIRQHHPEYTFISLGKDVELLKKRYEMFGIKGVYTKAQIDKELQTYENLMKHQQMGRVTSIYQAILDLGMMCYK